MFNFRKPSTYCNLTILIYVLFALYVIWVAVADSGSPGSSIDYELYMIYAAFIVPILLTVAGWAVYLSTPEKKKLPIYLIITTIFAIFATYFLFRPLFG